MLNHAFDRFNCRSTEPILLLNEGVKPLVPKRSVLIIVLALLLVGAVIYNLEDHMSAAALLERMRGSWMGQPLPFAIVAALGALIFAPFAPLGIAAGALFPPITAIIVAYTSGLAGACLCYFAARKLSGPLRKSLTRSRYAKALTAAMSKRGLEIVILVRLCPIIPYSLFNYLAGAVRAPAKAYLYGSAIGLLISSSIHVYEGTLLVELSSGRAADHMWWTWTKALILLVGLVALARVAKDLRAELDT